MIINIPLLFHTVRKLRFIQIYYQLWYRFKSLFIQNNKKPKPISEWMKIKWIDGLYNPKTYLRNNTFKFINIEHSFENKINWNLSTKEVN